MSVLSQVIDFRVYSETNNSGSRSLVHKNFFRESKDYGTLSSVVVSISALGTEAVADLTGTSSVIISCDVPIDVTITLGANSPITVLGQTLFVCSSGATGISLYNPSLGPVIATVLRLTDSGFGVNYELPITEVTFPAQTNIVPIGRSIIFLGNVEVRDVVYYYLVNDQVSAPASGLQAFRICNGDGSPNPNGSFLMYLNLDATQDNYTGTLKLWISEQS